MDKLLDKVYESIFNSFSEYGIKYVNVTKLRGYYLFSFDYDKVCHFSLEGRDKWLFGIWVTPDLEKKKVTIELFGEQKYYIDKFKPSASSISFDFELKLNDDNSFEDVDMLRFGLYDYELELLKIQESPLMYQYMLYGISLYKQPSFIGYLLSYTYEYLIYNRIFEWWKYDGLYYLSKYVFKPIINILCPKISVTVENMKGILYYPTCKLNLYYDKIDEDDFGRIYRNKFIRAISKIDHMRVDHYTDKNDKKGFYMKTED